MPKRSASTAPAQWCGHLLGAEAATPGKIAGGSQERQLGGNIRDGGGSRLWTGEQSFLARLRYCRSHGCIKAGQRRAGHEGARRELEGTRVQREALCRQIAAGQMIEGPACRQREDQQQADPDHRSGSGVIVVADECKGANNDEQRSNDGCEPQRQRQSRFQDWSRSPTRSTTATTPTVWLREAPVTIPSKVTSSCERQSQSHSFAIRSKILFTLHDSTREMRRLRDHAVAGLGPRHRAFPPATDADRIARQMICAGNRLSLGSPCPDSRIFELAFPDHALERFVRILDTVLVVSSVRRKQLDDLISAVGGHMADRAGGEIDGSDQCETCVPSTRFS